jgi:hypothetical protein
MSAADDIDSVAALLLTGLLEDSSGRTSRGLRAARSAVVAGSGVARSLSVIERECPKTPADL